MWSRPIGAYIRAMGDFLKEFMESSTRAEQWKTVMREDLTRAK